MSVGVHGARLAYRAGRAMGNWMKKKFGGRPSSYATRSRSGRGAEYGNITTQNDEALIYKRRAAPKRVRSKKRRAFRNFMYNVDKLQSMKTCVVNWYAALSTSATSVANAQAVTSVSLYGYGSNTYAGNTNTGNGDMWWIFSRENGADPSATLASRKLRFRSAVMDVSVTNTATATSTYLNGLLYVDVYHVIARKNLSNINVLTGDIGSYWNACINEEAGGNMPTAITNNNFYGVTPFDCSGFGRYYRIIKKRRIKLSPGQTYNTQIRDPGNYVLNMNDVLNVKSKNNLTEGLMFVAYNPTYQNSAIPGDINCTIAATKSYHYTELSSSVDSIGT